MKTKDRMGLITTILAVTLFVTAVFVPVRVAAQTTDAVLSFEGGNLYKADKIYIAQLSGTYYEMGGRQYGYLLKDQINSYYQKAIVEHSPWGGSWSREDAQSFAERYYSYYPARIKEVFNGMTETSGLPVDDLILIDQYTELFVLSAGFGCSSMAAWGDYTTDGKVVMGKNEDMPAFFKEFNDSLAVIVFNPTNGSRSVASVCNVGQVKTMNAISDVGISHATLQAPFLEGFGPDHETGSPFHLPFGVSFGFRPFGCHGSRDCKLSAAASHQRHGGRCAICIFL
jgi:hypothetical protein